MTLRPTNGVRTLAGLTVALTAILASETVTAQTPIPPSAQDFAMSAAQSDAYETLAADDALIQTQNPQVRAFAQEMIQDHARTSESLRRAALAAGMPAPAQAMNREQAAMLGALQGLRGSEFDKAYAKQQVLAHTQALAVEESYAEAGTTPSLKNAAREATPIIQHHLEVAQQLKATFDQAGG